MDIIVTKWIGLSATVWLAAEKREQLRERFPESFLRMADDLGKWLPDSAGDAAEKELLDSAGDASEKEPPESTGNASDESFCVEDTEEIRLAETSAEDAEEIQLAKMAGENVLALGRGGIFAGLWKMAEQFGCGIHADLRAIPVRQETIEFCEFFDLNPYRLESFGSCLIFANDGSKMLETLKENGIPAERIGRTTDGNDRILMNEDRVMYLTRPQPDEMEKIS